MKLCDKKFWGNVYINVRILLMLILIKPSLCQLPRMHLSSLWPYGSKLSSIPNTVVGLETIQSGWRVLKTLWEVKELWWLADLHSVGVCLWLAEQMQWGHWRVTRKGDNIMHYLEKGLNFRGLGNYMVYLSTYQNYTIRLFLGQTD